MRTIYLTQGISCVVDDSNYESLSMYKWCAARCGKKFYALRRVGGHAVYMHRFIMGDIPNDTTVDHINGISTDNRRENLRLATRRENSLNKKLIDNITGFKGVKKSLKNSTPSWTARIKVNGKEIHLGSYRTPTDAAIAYDAAARKYFGEFSVTNFQQKIDPPNRLLYVNNSSGYRGVAFNEKCNKWSAVIKSNKVTIYLGLHATAESAARSYDAAAIKYHGDAARLNFDTRNG